eukprot:CAMPEP_0115834178 /NCGR_PEP_ID=MMETSP0287-20121206/3551_1 /TAXON_ID=412157 /ORGANISM="Chrysochromulina rotalis, Strain UIO044" /LENGTH=520 /DNA_ID=CAMNT_0003287609 /DNA_START=26 /DNA_END=1588 /DNA_ORIENTATION=+
MTRARRFAQAQPLPLSMRRGTPTKVVLAKFGRIFRCRPDSLPLEERSQLYSLSEPCERFDYFLSHSWRASGIEKYIALALYLRGYAAFAMGAVVSTIVCVLQGSLNFPFGHVGQLGTRWGDDDSKGRVSVAELLSLLSFVWIGLLLGVPLPRRQRRQHCFLDCTSIAQADEVLKLKGVSRLSSYVCSSDRLIILWDKTYFSRLWCVYELAAITHFKPNAPIELLSIDQAMFTLAMQQVVGAFVIVILVLRVNEVQRAGAAISLLSYFGSLAFWGPALGYCLLSYFGTRFRLEQEELLQQLQCFNVREAGCSTERDRETILRSIGAHMFDSLDEFNEFVRTTLRSRVARRFHSQRARLPYGSTLLAISPTLGLLLMFYNYFKDNSVWPPEGPPLPFKAAWILTLLFWWLMVYPLILALVMHLAPPRHTWRGHLAVGVLMAPFVTCTVNLLGILPMKIARGELPCDHFSHAGELCRMLVPETVLPVVLGLHTPVALAAWWFYAPQSANKTIGKGRGVKEHGG